MSLTDSITALVRAAPPDATVPVRWLAEQLAADAPQGAPGDPTSAIGAEVDLTIASVAAAFGRAASTVREWLAAGRFPGAYKLGKEWRIPRADIERLQRAEAERFHSTPVPTLRRAEPADLSGWRDHLKAS